MRKQYMTIEDSIAEAIIREGAWTGWHVLKPLYRISALVLGPGEFAIERDYALTEVEREVMYGAQYEDALYPRKMNDLDYHLGSLPFSIKDNEEKPLGT